MLDQGRLLELRDKTSRLNIVGSILLLVNNTVGPPIHGVLSFKKNLKEHLAVLLDPVHSNKYNILSLILETAFNTNEEII